MSDPIIPETIMPGQGGTRLRSYALEALRDNWGWLLGLGILLIVVGMMAVGAAFITTLAAVVFFGVLMLVGAGSQVVGAFFCRLWGGFFLHLLSGVLYLIVGLLMVTRPIAAAEAMTLLIAAFLLIGGTFRIVVALTEPFQGRWWVLLNGVITLLLGILLLAKWPVSGLVAIGLFIGIELIFAGWSYVMLALAAHQLPADPK